MGELTDLIFTLLGKIGRWFNVRGQRICFIFWAICLVYWIARNYTMDLYVQTGGCLFSLGLHLYGWWNWKDKGIGK
jgi:nicotinamide riboside transporter PnuC